MFLPLLVCLSLFAWAKPARHIHDRDITYVTVTTIVYETVWVGATPIPSAGPPSAGHPSAVPPTPIPTPPTAGPVGSSFSGQGTFYNPSVGVGACGLLNQDSEFVVAISRSLFDSSNSPNPNMNPFCNRKIQAFRNGQSVNVTVVDRCPVCQHYDIDFSPAAFAQIATEAEGRVDISWNWI